MNTKKSLVIAEKPSVAMAIAKVLGVTEKKDGYLENDQYIISWCVGHLVGLASADAYDERYRHWDMNDLPILPERWKTVVLKDKTRQYNILKKLFERCDAVICATDAGREGELIFRNVYTQAGCTKPVYRLWISSMEDSAIREGFANLRPGSEYDRLYYSALSRSMADWLVGINCTRLYTGIYGTLLRVGRVQTPVLAMLVERNAQIENFIKEPYWNVHLSAGGLTVHKEKITDRAEAEMLCQRCTGQPMQITSVKRETKNIAPPRLYDLTTLQREANRYFGYTAAQTLEAVQSLYEKKLCTYPRTDSQYLTEDMEDTARRLVADCKGIFGFDDSNAGEPDVRRCINSKKVTDHHALLPTAEITRADLSQLPEREHNILRQIAMRLVCATGGKHLYEETQITAICAGETFTAKGRTILDNGWKQVEQQFSRSCRSQKEKSEEDAPALPYVTEGQFLSFVQANLTDHFTSPPKAYTEDTILSAMETAGNGSFDADTEKKGLGTPATRAEILEKLVKSGYAKRKGKSLVPTENGISLISVMPEQLKSPEMTAEWENTLMRIERGETTGKDFVTGITDMVRELVANAPKPAAGDKNLFSSRATDTIGTCPWCGGAVREGKANYYCTNKSCSFCMWKESRFLAGMKKSLTPAMAKDLLSNGRTYVKELYSDRKNTTFDAYLVLGETTDRNGKRITSFTLEFPPKKKKAGTNT